MIKIFRPWVLVTLGILFNIISAVITHYYIDINIQEIRSLENKISGIDTLIDSQWRTKTRIEQKEEFLILLLARNNNGLPENSGAIQQLINRQLVELVQQQNLTITKKMSDYSQDFDGIITLSAQAKRKIIETINTIYLDRLELERQLYPLNERNALLSTLAIFLQISGLILVLSKDISS